MPSKINPLSAGAITVAIVLPDGSAAAQQTLKSGTLRGAGGHQSLGQVRIVKTGNVTKVVFASNFRLDGAPDPRVAFGKDRYVRGMMFARLHKFRGAQEYVIPARFDIAKYNQVWLSCRKFNSPIAVARVK